MQMRRLAITATLAGALMTACGGGGLSDQEREEAMAGCLDGGATQAQCECIVDYYDEQGVESGEDLTQEIITGAVQACAGATG